MEWSLQERISIWTDNHVWKNEKLENPCRALVGQILLYWAAERLERSIFHKQDALSTLVNRCNCVR